MSKSATIEVPLEVLEQLQGLIAKLTERASPYRPDFLARMYRARASDLEGKGKSLSEVQARFQPSR